MIKLASDLFNIVAGCAFIALISALALCVLAFFVLIGWAIVVTVF